MVEGLKRAMNLFLILFAAAPETCCVLDVSCAGARPVLNLVIIICNEQRFVSQAFSQNIRNILTEVTGATE